MILCQNLKYDKFSGSKLLMFKLLGKGPRVFLQIWNRCQWRHLYYWVPDVSETRREKKIKPLIVLYACCSTLEPRTQKEMDGRVDWMDSACGIFSEEFFFMPLLHQLKNLHTSVVSLVCLFICCIIISIDYEVLVMRIARYSTSELYLM